MPPTCSTRCGCRASTRPSWGSRSAPWPVIVWPQLVKGQTVAVIGSKRDKYGRTLARLEIGGRDVNRQMVEDGLAWHYTQYDHDQRLDAAERDARAAKRGLWADAAPVPSWDWRAGERER